MGRENLDGRGTTGADSKTGILPLTDSKEGFVDAAPFLERIYRPGRFALHEVKFKDPTEGIGRVYVGRNKNTTYYAPEHEVELLPGITAIEASLQTAALVANQGRSVIPVWKAAVFEQTKAAPSGKFVDFNAVVEEYHGKLTATVDILNGQGEVIAQTTEIEGRLEEPDEAVEDLQPEPLNTLWLPEEFQPAAPLLSLTYHPSKNVINLMRFDGNLSGTGIVIAGQDNNSHYYARGHRAGQVPEIKLVHAAMQTATLIAAQENPSATLIPLYTAGAFHPATDSHMGEFAQIAAVVEIEKSNISATADILNPDGKPIAHISGIKGRLGKPGAMKRLLGIATRRT